MVFTGTFSAEKKKRTYGYWGKLELIQLRKLQMNVKYLYQVYIESGIQNLQKIPK